MCDIVVYFAQVSVHHPLRLLLFHSEAMCKGAMSSPREPQQQRKVWLAQDAGPPLLAYCPKVSLVDFFDNTFLFPCTLLAAAELCSLDATCKDMRQLGAKHHGAWHTRGMWEFHGIVLTNLGVYTAGTQSVGHLVDWKRQYCMFKSNLKVFRNVLSSEASFQLTGDEPALPHASHFNFKLSVADLVSAGGVFIEVAVVTNVGNGLLGIGVYCGKQDGGVLFCPDTGQLNAWSWNPFVIFDNVL